MACTVLVIDDSKVSRLQIIGTLKDAALFDRYCSAKDGLEGFNSLLESKADLVLCELEMPRADVFRFLQLVRARPELRDIPIIILTRCNDRESKIRGLEQGACDYVTKPFDAAELVARVKVHLKIKRLQDELRRATEHYRGLSNTDPLTNLYNRRF
ncbi:MAG TPA: response regulator, partial [Geobacteraceae bacterium]